MKNALLMVTLILACLADSFVSNVYCLEKYTITDLGKLSGTETIAYGINNVGQVVGESNSNAFLWNNGTMTNLGSFGGSISRAFDLNDNGVIVGKSANASEVFRGFVWDSVNGMIDLGTLGGLESKASSINNSNEIAGMAYPSDPTESRHPAYWNADREISDLGTFGGNEGSLERINNQGQAVGRARAISPSVSHAFIWDSVNGKQDLTPSSDFASFATGINELGQVVGAIDVGGNWELFYWSEVSGLELLGISAMGWGYKCAINEAGEIVGTRDGDGGSTSAFIYDKSTDTYSDLTQLIEENSGWDSLDTANDINEAGQIVGSGTKDGETRAFLLTPVDSAVPEPSVVLLFIGGCGFLFTSVRGRKNR